MSPVSIPAAAHVEPCWSSTPPQHPESPATRISTHAAASGTGRDAVYKPGQSAEPVVFETDGHARRGRGRSRGRGQGHGQERRGGSSSFEDELVARGRGGRGRSFGGATGRVGEFPVEKVGRLCEPEFNLIVE